MLSKGISEFEWKSCVKKQQTSLPGLDTAAVRAYGVLIRDSDMPLAQINWESRKLLLHGLLIFNP